MSEYSKGAKIMWVELLHEGWSSYVNLSGVLVIIVTGFVGKLLYTTKTPSKMLIDLVAQVQTWVIVC
jgi:hypothetical protein